MAEDKKFGDINITAGDGNSFGDVGHKVYNGPQYQTAAEVFSQIAHLLPRDKQITIEPQLTDAGTMRLTEELRELLAAKGYIRGLYSVGSLPYFKGYRTQDASDEFIVMLGDLQK